MVYSGGLNGLNGLVYSGPNTVHEILAIKISEKMLTQQKFNRFHRIQYLISLKQ